jgi:hypothetical protein
MGRLNVTCTTIFFSFLFFSSSFAEQTTLMEDAKKGLLADIYSEAVVRHEHPRSWSPNDFVCEVIRSIDISKFNITTLRDVWVAFWEHARDDPKLFDYRKVYLDYYSRRWGGTIKRSLHKYAGGPVDFVNIRLPSDGFVFSGTYLENLRLQINYVPQRTRLSGYKSCNRI